MLSNFLDVVVGKEIHTSSFYVLHGQVTKKQITFVIVILYAEILAVKIRQYNDKGIVKDDKEFKISQHACRWHITFTRWFRKIIEYCLQFIKYLYRYPRVGYKF